MLPVSSIQSSTLFKFALVFCRIGAKTLTAIPVDDICRSYAQIRRLDKSIPPPLQKLGIAAWVEGSTTAAGGNDARRTRRISDGLRVRAGHDPRPVATATAQAGHQVTICSQASWDGFNSTGSSEGGLLGSSSVPDVVMIM